MCLEFYIRPIELQIGKLEFEHFKSTSNLNLLISDNDND